MRFAACCLALLPLAGCAPVYERIAPEVDVLAGNPMCAFEKLGALSAHDGRNEVDAANRQGGAGSIDRWGDVVDERAVLADLREQAARLGANAIVVRGRTLGASSGRHSLEQRPKRSLTIRAIAIRTATPPLAPPCNAVAWR